MLTGDKVEKAIPMGCKCLTGGANVHSPTSTIHDRLLCARNVIYSSIRASGLAPCDRKLARFMLKRGEKNTDSISTTDTRRLSMTTITGERMRTFTDNNLLVTSNESLRTIPSTKRLCKCRAALQQGPAIETGTDTNQTRQSLHVRGR